MCYERYDKKGRLFSEDNVKCHRRLLKNKLLDKLECDLHFFSNTPP